jgi:ABC-type cobalamin/Fe3+-siderophores transport system ATPase subunit
MYKSSHLTRHSGKSSLLNLLFCIMESSTGTVSIDGVDISTISLNQVRGSLNALSQEPFFLYGTVRDNLITAARTSESDERLQQVLARVGLWSKILDLGGLDVFLHPEESLSHGEKQLFCLARALLDSSRILILDEFTSKYVLPLQLSLLVPSLQLRLTHPASISIPIRQCKRLFEKTSRTGPFWLLLTDSIRFSILIES